MSKKNNKYQIKQGITGIGEDYNIYTLTIKEMIIGYLIGFAAGFAAAYIMFSVLKKTVREEKKYAA